MVPAMTITADNADRMIGRKVLTPLGQGRISAIELDYGLIDPVQIHVNVQLYLNEQWLSLKGRARVTLKALPPNEIFEATDLILLTDDGEIES